MAELDREKLKQSLNDLLVARQSKEFRDWLEARRGDLEYEYDCYAGAEYTSYQEPMGYEEWAFHVWLNDEGDDTE